ncbi:hypothetical protein Chor_005160 [Crotalus horridus]
MLRTGIREFKKKVGSSLAPKFGSRGEGAFEAEKIQGSRISVGTQTEALPTPGRDAEKSLSNGGLQQAEESSATRGKSLQDSSNVGEMDFAEGPSGGGGGGDPIKVATNSLGPPTERENVAAELQTVQEDPETHNSHPDPTSRCLQEAQDVGEPPPDATRDEPPSPGQSRLGGQPLGPGSASPEPPSEGSSSSSTPASPVPTLQNVMATKKELLRRNSSSDKLARTKQPLPKKAASSANLFNRSSSLENRSKDPTLSPEGLSIKMFLRGRPITMYIPSDFHNYEDLRMELPTQKLQLDWVYGYRGRDCRSNLYVLTSGELVYFIACVVVLYHVQRRTQRHYLRHTDCVRCLAPLQPFVHIWDSVTLLTLQQIGLGSFERGVGSLAFSTAGAYLCVIDESNEHMLSVWDCLRGTKQAEIKSTNESVLMVEFNPQDSSNIITAGKSHVYFWTWKYKKPKFIQCFVFDTNGDVLTGDSEGNILTWARAAADIRTLGKGAKETYQISKQTHAHEGSIFCLCLCRDGSVLSGGGKDRRLLQWSPLLTVLQEVEIPEQFGAVRTIAEGESGELLVGTTRNALLRGSLAEGFKPIIQGHSSFITHLDWSKDGKFIMSNSGDYEILYLRNRFDNRDREWASYTCVLGFHVFGVWPDGSDGTDINALCRSHNERVVAVADDFCKVHLFQYPCAKPKAPSHVYTGHGSHVTNVRFTHDDGHLISMGGKDTSIFQWRMLGGSTPPASRSLSSLSSHEAGSGT